MFAMLMEMQVPPEHRQTLVDALVADGSGSLSDEPGTLRFDLYEDPEQPGKFYLIEAYVDEAALQSHLNGAHFPAVGKVLGELREKGVLTVNTIARPNAVFLSRAERWSLDRSHESASSR